MPTWSKRSLLNLALSAIILFAFALRVYHLSYQPLWRDEVDAIRFSSESALNLVRMLTRVGHNGPLYFALLRVWRDLTGNSEFALRYLSVVGGVLMVPLTYRVGRRFKLPSVAALTAALLVTTSPYLHWYSQEAKMYTWLAVLILPAAYAYHSALSVERPIRYWAGFVIVSSLSFYVHILAPLMLAVYLLWAAIEWRKVKAHWRGWLISMALLTLPYLPLAAWQAPLFVEKFNSGHPFYPISEQMRLLLHFYSVGLLRYDRGIYLMAGAAILAVIGGAAAYITTRPPSFRVWLQFGIWFIAPPLLVYFISLRVTVFEDRYLIYILPAFYLLIATGLLALNRLIPWSGWLVLAILIGFNLWGIHRQSTNTIKADFRSAAAYIARASGGRPVVMFQMPYLQFTFDYYYHRRYCAMEGLWTNDNRSPNSVDREMTQRTAKLSSLWLVLAEEDQWDSRHLTREWLNQNAVVQDEAHFAGVDVYRYQLEQATASLPANFNALSFKVYLPFVTADRGCPAN